MILTKEIKIYVKPTNFKHLTQYYPDAKINVKMTILTKHLPTKSGKKVLVKCEVCGFEHEIPYRKYIENKSRYGYYSCKKCKNIKTKKTCMKIYGDENYNNSQQMRKTKQQLGVYLNDEDKPKLESYRSKVYNLTLKNKKQLFEIWDGYDFYDNEYIKNYKDPKSKNYPTIDHKISVLYGFKNNIHPEIISNMNNLCITKRTNNSKKGSNNIFIADGTYSL